jgi:2-oxoglutarate ferredoxin oxidoreductase subunit delta
MGSPKKKYTINVNEGWCKGCNICVHFCPKKVLSLTRQGKVKVDNQDACIGCKLCELRCPDLAITITECKKED